jgi:glycosyltransferase involved in cell wall biosynthesis
MESFVRSSVLLSNRLLGKARQLVMLGTSVDTKGGISSVVNLYESAGLFRKWNATYIATHCDGSFVQKFAKAARAWFRVLNLLANRRDIVLHVHCASRASFWRKYVFIVPAVYARKPVIFHLHGAEFDKFYAHECGPIRKSMVRWLLGRCSKIVVLSKSWESFLRQLTQVSIEIVPNPAIDFLSSESVTRKKSALLFLGRLGRRKGIYTLLQAFTKVVHRFPAATLICGGDGEIDLVEKRAEELGIRNSVELVGWVDGSEKLRLLQSSTIYVLPSFAEGVPISVLEAMSAGLPIVSTTVGGIPDVVTAGEDGLLIAPGDVVALASAICALLENEDLRNRLGRNAHARFQREFSMSSVLPRLESIYRELEVSPRQAIAP